MAAVEERSGAVERVAQYAEATLAAQRELESRREFVETLERRLTQLGALSSDLDQRARTLEERRAALADFEARADGLRARLDDADRRFGAVAARAGEAGQVESRVSEVTARAQAAEERMAALSHGLEDVAARESRLEELAAGGDLSSPGFGRDSLRRPGSVRSGHERLCHVGLRTVR